jgi:trk system potassium uptake protein TrkA
MKSFAVIGFGSFGSNVAQTLFEKGHEVLVIDSNKAVVQKAQDFCSQAVVADATDKETMEDLGINNFDTVIVALGERMEDSILTILHLKELGLKSIIAKAINIDHMKVLSKVGANRIIFPERDMAIRLAKQLSTPNILDYLPIAEDSSIQEIVAPKSFLGKTVRELDLRNKFGCLIIAIKNKNEEKFSYIPASHVQIKEDDILIVLGINNDLERLKKVE